MKIEGARVLVTGGGGFIGSHLVEALLQEHARVTAMVHYDVRAELTNLEFLPDASRKAIRVLSGDITDPFFVSSAVEGHEVVFHLAALIAIPYSYIAPLSFVRTNVEGTLNVLEACRTHDVRRIIHTSTSETYGTAQYVPIDEKHPLQGQSPYSASKIGADKIAESYFSAFNLPLTTVRPFNTYGPRQSARAVIPTIISQALWNDQVRLGSLSPVRDLTFVRDTVAGFIALAKCDAAVGKVVNLGTGTAVSIGELAERILALVGSKAAIVEDSERIRPDKSEVMRLLSDPRLAFELASWRAEVSLEAGLEETVGFVKSHRDLFRPETYAR